MFELRKSLFQIGKIFVVNLQRDCSHGPSILLKYSAVLHIQFKFDCLQVEPEYLLCMNAVHMDRHPLTSACFQLSHDQPITKPSPTLFEFERCSQLGKQ